MTNRNFAKSVASAVTAGLFIFIYSMLNGYIDEHSFGAFSSFFLTIAIILVNAISFVSAFLSANYALQSIADYPTQKVIKVSSFIILGLSLVFLGVNIYLLCEMSSILMKH